MKSDDLSGDRTYYTTDGSFLTVLVRNTSGQCSSALVDCPWTLYFPDGSQMAQETFSMGNFVLTSRTGNQTALTRTRGGGITTTEIKDSSNRALTLRQAYYGNPMTATTDTITAAGTDGAPLETKVAWQLYTIPRRTYTCSLNLPDCSLDPASVVAVGSIELPKQWCDDPTTNCGLGYQFTYDRDPNGGGIGQLSSMTTPLGATARYHFEMDDSDSGTWGWAKYISNRLTSKSIEAASNEAFAWPTETTSYQYSTVNNVPRTTVTNPEGDASHVTVYHYFTAYPPTVSLPKGSLIFRIDHPNGSRTERYWSDNTPAGAPTNPTFVFNNPYIKAEFTALGGLTSAKEFLQDANGNLTQVSEYDWFNSANNVIPRSADPYQSPSGFPTGLTPVRTTVTEYTNSAGSSPYTSTASQVYRSAAKSQEVREGGAPGTLRSRVDYSYAAVNAALPTSLQMTQQRRWDSIKAPAVPVTLDSNSAAVTDYAYDVYGSLTQVTEPGRSNADRTVNTYSYDGSATVNGELAPGTFLKTATRASGADGQTIATYAIDPFTGLATSTEPDQVNGLTISTDYDALGRPTLTKEKGSGTGALERQTAVKYSLQQRRIVTQRSKDAADVSAGVSLVTAQHFDSRGRLWRTRTLEDGLLASAIGSNSSGIVVETRERRSAVGRCRVVSHPYKDTETTAPTMGWTLTNLDVMGRPTSVYHFSGATAPVCGTANSLPTTGHTETIYDQVYAVDSRSGVLTEWRDEKTKVRRGVADGLGRMFAVYEDPAGSNYRTNYSYNVLDNLTGVTPQGGQSRTFNYDSLQRLTSSYQPEMNPAGTGATLAASYTYTNDGQVLTRTDGNGVQTTYGYDALNRVVRKTYTGTTLTPSVTYCYDGKVASGDGLCTAASYLHSHGRLTESRASLQVGTETRVSSMKYAGYDVLGRVTNSEQTTNGSGPHTFSYGWNLAGGLTSLTYPSGRVVTTTYDTAGRASEVKKGTTSESYASLAGYAPHGGLISLKLQSASMQQTWSYNSRLQMSGMAMGPTSGAALTLGLDYGGTRNNGNLMGQSIVSAT